MSTASSPICILTIAGSDSGAGAGVQADSRVIHALGGYATTAITAVTAQNTQGISDWRPLAPALIARQITAVIGDFNLRAIKTGLLPGAAAVRAVVHALKSSPRIPLVVDPVIGSTSGTRFLPKTGVKVLLEELLPRASLITPNWPEIAQLSGQSVATLSQAESAGRALLESTGCRAILVKGGHSSGPTCEDLLLLSTGRTYIYAHRRIGTKNTHGTGCVLSAAIATRIALGDELPAAVQTATDFLHRALLEGKTKRWGRGVGPAFAGLIKSPNR